MYLYPIRGPPVNTVADAICVFKHRMIMAPGSVSTLPLLRLLCFHLRPSCLDSFAVGFAELFRRHVGDPLLSADLSALSSCFDKKR